MELKHYYDQLPERSFPAPKRDFINRVAEITERSPQTVKMWISGARNVTEAGKVAFSEVAGIPVTELFPTTDETN